MFDPIPPRTLYRSSGLSDLGYFLDPRLGRRRLLGLLLVWMTGKPARAGTTTGEAAICTTLAEQVWQLVDDQFAGSFDREAWARLRPALVQRCPRDRADTYRQLRRVLEGLKDPYTRLLTPEEFAAFSRVSAGADSGVGLRLEPPAVVGRPPAVARVIEGSPAWATGIREGDLLVAIDRQPVAGLKAEEISRRLRGRAGSRVRLVLKRGRRTLKLDLTRSRFRVPAS